MCQFDESPGSRGVKTVRLGVTAPDTAHHQGISVFDECGHRPERSGGLLPGRERPALDDQRLRAKFRIALDYPPGGTARRPAALVVKPVFHAQTLNFLNGEPVSRKVFIRE